MQEVMLKSELALCLSSGFGEFNKRVLESATSDFNLHLLMIPCMVVNYNPHKHGTRAANGSPIRWFGYGLIWDRSCSPERSTWIGNCPLFFLSHSAYNYDSSYGKKALLMMYRGIMEQDSLPVVLPNCSSDNPATVRDFIEKGKAALVSVGIVRDTVVGNGKDSGKFSGHIVDSDMHDVGRLLNRLFKTAT
ncbi:hypothetical protein OSB04_026518 [Centaurea solstitialis]|uniref:Uncharacterized protein n=1 Tax=Centaurea solstitialis TaxID=347529 RepID=A0AA38SVJ7_9ASTR|nr:hypothetical protein OSB04_026518 [Centaurea solstitialis]